VQSTIYQDDLQSQVLRKMEVEQKLIPWCLPNKLAGLYWWLVAWFWKPIDIALVTCKHPELYGLNLAKRVYYFTGNGYVPVSTNPLVLTKAVFKTVSQMWQIYWRIRRLNLSPIMKAIPTPLFPLVSIVICTSDRPNFLEKALKSLELIRYSHFEVIVIDGSSTTETSEIVHTLSSRNSFRSIL
jgi:hypothetical protein